LVLSALGDAPTMGVGSGADGFV